LLTNTGIVSNGADQLDVFRRVPGHRMKKFSLPKDRKGVDVMKGKLLALPVGVAMLAGAGTAYADAIVSAATKAGTPTTADLQKAAPEVKAPGQGRRPPVLTETQMDKITAGGGKGDGGIGLRVGSGEQGID
jgi:hypothetical protein